MVEVQLDLQRTILQEFGRSRAADLVRFGSDGRNGNLFCYVDLEERVPADHPLRVMRAIADEVLAGISAQFERGCSRIGRPSIAPERLMQALLLQAFYSIR